MNEIPIHMDGAIEKFLSKLKPPIIFFAVWLLLILLMLKFPDNSVMKNISSVVMNSNLLVTVWYIISLALGIYMSYKAAKWMHKRLSYTDFGLWLIRGISIGLIAFGSYLWVLALFFLPLWIQTNTTSSGFAVLMTRAFILGFSTIMLYGGYLQFLFKRKVGSIHFIGKF